MQGTTMTAFMASRAPLTEPEQNLQCPRCESKNTKFCYYNNYNLSQPRHFCKDCRRYWTKGGTLRNVPVGGGTRKNSKRSLCSSGGINSKRPSPSSSSGEVKNSDFFSSSIPTVENDHRMLDMNGSFSSLLSSTAQFGNFFECFQSLDSLPISKAESSGNESEAAAAPPAMQENFLSLPGDTSSWADLSIYSAPGRNFQ